MIETDYGDFDRFSAWIGKLAHVPSEDLRPLAERLVAVVTEDNRKGVLEGVDADDQAAPPLEYRSEGFGAAPRARGRTGSLFGTTMGRFKGMSTATFKGTVRRGELTGTRHRRPITTEVLPNNNLSTSTYQQLDGPRLAPRGEESRVISNFAAERPEFRPDGITLGFGWVDVLSVKGVPFLPFHFRGAGHLPRYDLRGIRRWGREEVARSMDEWWGWMLGR